MKYKKYKIVTITNDLNAYAEYEKYTLNYPELVEYVVEDEVSSFVIDEHNIVYPVNEFFHMVDIKEFYVNE